MDTIPIIRCKFPVMALQTYEKVDINAVCGKIGIDIGLIEDSSARIRLEQLSLLYEEAVRVTGDDDFGLHVPERIPLQHLDVLTYLTASASSLRRVFENLAPRTENMLAGEAVALTEDGDTAAFTYRVLDRRSAAYRQHPEANIAWVLRFARHALGRHLVPQAVMFQHTRPRSISEHRRLFEAPVHFNRPDNRLVFAGEILDYPLPKADPSLFRVLDRHVTTLVERLPQGARRNLVEAVRGAIFNSIGEGDSNLPAIARKLGMSPRTLQRHLGEEGFSVRQLVDEVRCGLARRHVREGILPVAEIAARLGYGDVKAFYAAFRRWTGQSPRKYRRAHTDPG
jgi:AraC-like DNA-binding protein